MTHPVMNAHPVTTPGESGSGIIRLPAAEEVHFLERHDILTHQQDQYYQDLFYRVLKIGTEIEFSRPKTIDIDDLRSELEVLLKPSRDLENLGELGIFDVVKEHCGAEIQVIGRHPHWNALWEQYRKVFSILVEKQVRIRPTCGLHFHLIAVGLAETIPAIILANLWNLVRRHAPGLKFLFSGGTLPNALCRRRQHNAHYEFMRLSPNEYTMKVIKEKLRNSTDVPEHQNFFNLERQNFNDSGELSNFHVELRFPDGDLSPTSIVAKTFLFFALVLKAVEISKYGLIDPGSPELWQRKQQLMDLLSNNKGDLASSDTSGIGAQEIKELQNNAGDLLVFLKSTFNRFTNPAYNVIKSLITKPIALRRIEQDDWQVIEYELRSIATYPFFIDLIDAEIIKTIELGLVKGKASVNAWLMDVARLTGLKKTEIKHRIDGYIEKYPVWDTEIGAFVFQR